MLVSLPSVAEWLVGVVGIIRKGPPHSQLRMSILRCFIALCPPPQSGICTQLRNLNYSWRHGFAQGGTNPNW